MLIPGTEGQGPEGLGIWAYNYTINPEDGDVGVFCHEFGHDLGLPDEYDYSSATGDATSGFWTIMASGSWLGRQWGIGTQPAAMNVWDKSALGFIQPKVVKRGRATTVKLQAAAEGDPTDRREDPAAQGQPHHQRSAAGRRAGVVLHDRQRRGRPAPHREPDRGPRGGDLTFRTWYDIEQGYDHGFVQVSDDGGGTWETVKDFTGSDTDHWADTVTSTSPPTKARACSSGSRT